jgi:hypothetical protein
LNEEFSGKKFSGEESSGQSMLRRMLRPRDKNNFSEDGKFT